MGKIWHESSYDELLIAVVRLPSQPSHGIGIDHWRGQASEVALRNIGRLLWMVNAIVEPVYELVDTDIANRGLFNLNENK